MEVHACVQLRLGWGSLVEPGRRARSPPTPHTPPHSPPRSPPHPPTTPHSPPQPLASLRHRRGVYLSPTKTFNQHVPRSSWTLAKLGSDTFYHFARVFSSVHYPFFKHFTQSQLIICQHHSSNSTSSVINLFKHQHPSKYFHTHLKKYFYNHATLHNQLWKPFHHLETII